MVLENIFEQISNADLIEQDLPAPHSDFLSIWKFTWSYNAYAKHSFNKSAEMAYECEKAYSAKKSLSKFSLTKLRTVLFFEERRYHHWGWNPDDEEFGSKEQMQYIWGLVEAIREKVHTKKID